MKAKQNQTKLVLLLLQLMEVDAEHVEHAEPEEDTDEYFSPEEYFSETDTTDSSGDTNFCPSWDSQVSYKDDVLSEDDAFIVAEHAEQEEDAVEYFSSESDFEDNVIGAFGGEGPDDSYWMVLLVPVLIILIMLVIVGLM